MITQIAREETRCRHIGYSFRLAARFFYMHHPTDRIIHTTAFVTPVVEHWLEYWTLLSMRNDNIVNNDMFYSHDTGVGSGGGEGGGQRGHVPPHIFDWGGNGMFVPPPPPPTLLTPHFYFPLELYVCITLTNNYLAFFIYQLIILWTISINWHRWLLLNNHISKYNSFILVLYRRYINYVSVCPPPPPPHVLAPSYATAWEVHRLCLISVHVHYHSRPANSTFTLNSNIRKFGNPIESGISNNFRKMITKCDIRSSWRSNIQFMNGNRNHDIYNVG